MALKIAIFHHNIKAVGAFLAFSKQNMITLIIEQKDMETLIATENFATIQNLVQSSAQIEKKQSHKMQSLTDRLKIMRGESKKLENSKVMRVSLTLANAIDHTYEMDNQYVNDQFRVRMIVYLQNSLDFQSLTNHLIRRKKFELMFRLFQLKELKKKNKKKAIIVAFNQSLVADELAQSLTIWVRYG